MINNIEGAMEKREKASKQFSDCEVMELRFFLKKGKIVWVEPIDPKDVNGSKATGEVYTVSIVDDLRKEPLRGVSPVAFQQDSPACLFWWVYVDAAGNIEKVCLA
jgi:hypothetical protein